MQRIAAELHFSESTFVLLSKCAGNGGGHSAPPGGFPARIFTPAHEVDFAGHPTLGTAHVIRENLLGTRVPSLTLALKAGAVPVRFSDEPDGPLWMDQIEPEFGDPLDADALAEVLSLRPSAIDARFPVAQVSTGLPHVIVPLCSVADLAAARVDREGYFRLIERTWAKNILVFCPQ